MHDSQFFAEVRIEVLGDFQINSVHGNDIAFYDGWGLIDWLNDRLVELNLGDESVLQREVSALTVE